MIDRYVSHNGVLLPMEQARLSPGQAGLLAGWGLFTTLRIHRGEAFAYERHWRRLEKDSRITRIPLPFDPGQVRAQLAEVIRANGVEEGCARIYVVYNKAGFWQGAEEMPEVDLILYTAPLPNYREPARLAIAEHGRHAASPLAGVKVTSWLNNVWNLGEAVRAGYDEVILLNERGEVAECTAANIFLAKEGRVFTPPLSSGCLEGVTRGVLLEIGLGSGLSIQEQSLKPDDLLSADEVFLSSTNRGVLTVDEIAGRKIPTAPGPVAKRLEVTFAAYLEEYVGKRATEARSGR